MAQLALEKFREYNDLYQIAGAYVSIGKYMNCLLYTSGGGSGEAPDPAA